ncbi:MAG: hypothetical protein WDW36_001099 [Sanguina aurantia]
MQASPFPGSAAATPSLLPSMSESAAATSVPSAAAAAVSDSSTAPATVTPRIATMLPAIRPKSGRAQPPTLSPPALPRMQRAPAHSGGGGGAAPGAPAVARTPGASAGPAPSLAAPFDRPVLGRGVPPPSTPALPALPTMPPVARGAPSRSPLPPGASEPSPPAPSPAPLRLASEAQQQQSPPAGAPPLSLPPSRAVPPAAPPPEAVPAPPRQRHWHAPAAHPQPPSRRSLAPSSEGQGDRPAAAAAPRQHHSTGTLVSERWGCACGGGSSGSSSRSRSRSRRATRPLDSNSAPASITPTPASSTSRASQGSDAAAAGSETPPAPQAVSAAITPAATAAALACGEWHLLIHVVTFNMNSTTPDALPDALFGAWEKGADLYMFGSQESGSLPDWERLLAARLGQRYQRVGGETLRWIHLVVFARAEVAPYIGNLQQSSVPCGVGNVILLVNCHLAAHDQYTEKRNADYHRICAGLFTSSQKPTAGGPPTNPRMTRAHSSSSPDLLAHASSTSVVASRIPSDFAMYNKPRTPSLPSSSPLQPANPTPYLPPESPTVGLYSSLPSPFTVTPPTDPNAGQDNTPPPSAVAAPKITTPSKLSPDGNAPPETPSITSSLSPFAQPAQQGSPSHPTTPPPPPTGIAAPGVLSHDQQCPAHHLQTLLAEHRSPITRIHPHPAVHKPRSTLRTPIPRKQGLSTAARRKLPARHVTAGEAEHFPAERLRASRGGVALLEAHDVVLWAGDLNYRIQGNSGAVLKAIDKNLIEVLHVNDQLGIQRKQGKVFQGFSEQEIQFPPTFKFKLNSAEYNPSRVPSWTDRVLHRCNAAPGMCHLLPLYYDSVSAPCLGASDHRPVVAGFELTVRRGGPCVTAAGQDRGCVIS